MASLEDYLAQWNRMGESLNKQMAPAINLRESVQKAITPLLKTQENLQAFAASVDANQKALNQISASALIQQQAFQQALGSVVSQQQVWSRALEALKLPDLSQLATQATVFQESILNQVSPVFEQLQRSFLELPPRTQEAILVLGSHGLYMDMEMTLPDLWNMKEALLEGDVDTAEQALVTHFEKRIDEIEASILAKFPHRAHIISKAFKAHRREEYELTIPVLLAQTDGICKETISQYLFIRRNKKPGTAVYVEQIAGDAFQAALLSPLANVLPISQSEQERPAGGKSLNRHTVMHGDSLNYGNKTNSLKAISLINYVAHALKEDTDTSS